MDQKITTSYKKEDRKAKKAQSKRDHQDQESSDLADSSHDEPKRDLKKVSSGDPTEIDETDRLNELNSGSQKIGGMYKKEERKIKRAVVAQAQNSAQS